MQSKKMETTSKLIKKKSISDISELRNLIMELMIPRLVLIDSIVSTQIVPVTWDDFDYGHGGESDDWWPDYTLYSETHAITDLNGLLYYAQNTLKGLPIDFQQISEKFESYHMKRLQKSSNDRNQRSRYRLILSLIEDINVFIINLNRQCDKWLSQRRNLYDLVSDTRNTSNRIQLKAFDETTFVQLHSRMSNMKSFITDFGLLFQTPLKIETTKVNKENSEYAKPKVKMDRKPEENPKEKIDVKTKGKITGKPKIKPDIRPKGKSNEKHNEKSKCKSVKKHNGKSNAKPNAKRNEKTTATKTKKVRLAN